MNGCREPHNTFLDRREGGRAVVNHLKSRSLHTTRKAKEFVMFASNPVLKNLVADLMMKYKLRASRPPKGPPWLREKNIEASNCNQDLEKAQHDKHAVQRVKYNVCVYIQKCIKRGACTYTLPQVRRETRRCRTYNFHFIIVQDCMVQNMRKDGS